MLYVNAVLYLESQLRMVFVPERDQLWDHTAKETTEEAGILKLKAGEGTYWSCECTERPRSMFLEERL